MRLFACYIPSAILGHSELAPALEISIWLKTWPQDVHTHQINLISLITSGSVRCLMKVSQYSTLKKTKIDALPIDSFLVNKFLTCPNLHSHARFHEGWESFKVNSSNGFKKLANGIFDWKLKPHEEIKKEIAQHLWSWWGRAIKSTNVVSSRMLVENKDVFHIH